MIQAGPTSELSPPFHKPPYFSKTGETIDIARNLRRGSFWFSTKREGKRYKSY